MDRGFYSAWNRHGKLLYLWNSFRALGLFLFVTKQQAPGAGAVCYPNYVTQSSTKRDLHNDNVSNSSITPEEIQENGLVIRGEPAEYEAFPGDIKYGPVKSRPATPSEMLENDAKERLGDATEGAIGCKTVDLALTQKTRKRKGPVVVA